MNKIFIPGFGYIEVVPDANPAALAANKAALEADFSAVGGDEYADACSMIAKIVGVSYPDMASEAEMAEFKAAFKAAFGQEHVAAVLGVVQGFLAEAKAQGEDVEILEVFLGCHEGQVDLQGFVDDLLEIIDGLWY